MKLAGFLLLLAGWVLVAASLALLSSAAPRAGFVVAGLVVELFGLALAFHSHLQQWRSQLLLRRSQLHRRGEQS